MNLVCVDAIPRAEAVRRLRWMQLCLDQSQAHEILLEKVREAVAGRWSGRHQSELAVVLAAFDRTEAAIAQFKEESK